MRALSRHLPGKSPRLRFRGLLSEAMKFGVVGAINLVVNFVVFLALATTVFAGSELKANVVAFVVATTSSYLMNRYWTFRYRPRSTHHREYVLFFVFNLAGLGIELAVMGLAKYGLGLTSLIPLAVAKGLGIGLGTIFRFYTYRTFVFSDRRLRRRPVPASEPEAAPPVVASRRPEPAESGKTGQATGPALAEPAEVPSH